MRFRQVAKGLYRATRRWTNVYLAVRNGHSILIDTGEPDFAPRILKALKSFPPFRQILLTHCHYDHAGSAAFLSAELGVDVFAHPAEVDLLRIGRWRRPVSPAPDALGRFITHFLAGRFPDQLEPIANIKTLEDADQVAWEGAGVIALPGHSEGQLCFVVPVGPRGRSWIVGDAIMSVPGIRLPILFEDIEQGRSSISKLAEAVQMGDSLCPGHGATVTMSDRVAARLKALAGPQSRPKSAR